jgi:hypothetical protein
MPTTHSRRQWALNRIDATWRDFQASFAGLPDEAMKEPGVTGDWSVKDILAHVTAWEEETLAALPVLATGSRPPTYDEAHGGVDAFNAMTSARDRDRTLADIRHRLEETHRRLVAYVETVPDELLAGETRFRQRLRGDTWGHYPEHAAAIRAWRPVR